MSKEKKGPDTPSSDYLAMKPHWDKVSAVMGGIDEMRKRGSAYLPKYDKETDDRYKYRLSNTKLTNIYWDVVDNLARRPFANPVVLKEGTANPLIEQLANNVDNRGMDMHEFAKELFLDGINNAIDWIIVDYPKKPEEAQNRVLSVKEEKELNLRPYWRRYSAHDMIAVYSDYQPNGEEVLIHVRMMEHETRVSDFEEVKVPRVRQIVREKNESGWYGDPICTVWEKRKKEHSEEMEWVVIDGPFTMDIRDIPLVPFITGSRVNPKGWQFEPPMKSALDLQIDHYQEESGLKHIKKLAAYPMLSGNKVSPELDENDKPVPLIVGPMAALYAPEGAWQILEPSSGSMKFLAEDNKDCAKEIRELGRQPLTAQSGNLTVITTAFAAEKGNSAIQNWALAMKYSLERAWKLTCMWLNIADLEVEVNVSLNFDTSYGEDQSFSNVVELGTGDDPLISRQWVIHEGKRRGILDPDYDEEEDLVALLEQEAGDEDDDEEVVKTTEDPDGSIDEGGRPEGEDDETSNG